MMYEQGFSKTQIALAEGVPAGTVHGIATRYTQQISGMSQERPGQPQKLSDRDKRYIMRLIEADPFIKNQEILDLIDADITIRTLNRYLQSEGIQHMHALRRPKLSASAAWRRLRFAQEHIDKPISFWRKVIWSDETKVQLKMDKRQQYVYMRRVSAT